MEVYEGFMHRRSQCWRVLLGLSLMSFILLQGVPAPVLAAYAPLPQPEVAASLLCPPTLTFGLPIQCAIEHTHEQHIYPFTAAVDDKLKIRIQVVGGTLDPAIHIYKQSGEQICTAFTSQILAEIGNCALPVAGNYTLVVDDTYHTNTGQYFLYAQRLNNPDNANPLVFGQTFTNSLQLVAEFTTYTIAVSAGATVRFRMMRLDGSFYPRLRLYDLAGGQLCSAFSSGPIAEINSCTFPKTGRYAILVDDTYTSGIGSYALEQTCLDQVCAPASVSVYIPLVIASRS